MQEWGERHVFTAFPLLEVHHQPSLCGIFFVLVYFSFPADKRQELAFLRYIPFWQIASRFFTFLHILYMSEQDECFSTNELFFFSAFPPHRDDNHCCFSPHAALAFAKRVACIFARSRPAWVPLCVPRLYNSAKKSFVPPYFINSSNQTFTRISTMHPPHTKSRHAECARARSVPSDRTDWTALAFSALRSRICSNRGFLHCTSRRGVHLYPVRAVGESCLDNALVSHLKWPMLPLGGFSYRITNLFAYWRWRRRVQSFADVEEWERRR